MASQPLIQQPLASALAIANEEHFDAPQSTIDGSCEGDSYVLPAGWQTVSQTVFSWPDWS